MIKRKTVIDKIEMSATRMDVRFALLVVEDGVETDRKLHRATFLVDSDVDQHIAMINGDITTRPSLRAAPFDDPGEIARLKKCWALTFQNR